MRRGWLELTLLVAQLQLATAFIPEATATSTYGSATTAVLVGRADTCPSNTFQCSQDLGEKFNGICCQDGQSCALDSDNNPACCPSGAVCTGTAPASATGQPTAPASFVSNDYFSFPYAPTSYHDSDECRSAVTDCSENYHVCLTYLESGGSFGVTVAVPGGGGTTVAGGGTITGTSATSICSSLSSQACSKLEATSCAKFGSAAPVASRVDWLLAAFSVTLSLFVINA
ncbi:hypothetical protein BGZ63DRAFT_402292 [Mariannaea sp. PMI_226]|nr:hypothetical protein BGZ63DRAFT_402292 [Mariannaea sp. PMI_226]